MLRLKKVYLKFIFSNGLEGIKELPYDLDKALEEIRTVYGAMGVLSTFKFENSPEDTSNSEAKKETVGDVEVTDLGIPKSEKSMILCNFPACDFQTLERNIFKNHLEGDHKLSESASEVLTCVIRNPGIFIGSIGEQTALSYTAVRPALDDLVSGDLIHYERRKNRKTFFPIHHEGKNEKASTEEEEMQAVREERERRLFVEKAERSRNPENYIQRNPFFFYVEKERIDEVKIQRTKKLEIPKCLRCGVALSKRQKRYGFIECKCGELYEMSFNRLFLIKKLAKISVQEYKEGRGIIKKIEGQKPKDETVTIST